MNGEIGYFINRFWIAEYIQYIQEVSVVPVCSTQVEGATIPLSTTPCSPDGFSTEYALPWDNVKLEPAKWRSHGNQFSAKGYDVLYWMLRWVGPVC